MDNSIKQKPNLKMLGIIIAIVILALIVLLLIDSNKTKQAKILAQNTPTTTEQVNTPTETATSAPVVNTVLPQDTKVEVVGANPITKEGIVVTPTGGVVKNDVVPSTPEAPQQTAPITKAQLPASALKLDVSSAGYLPKEITVKAGAAVTLSVTSVDQFTHIFMFDDPSLSAVAIGVGPSETRAITFNAPAKAGNYTFRCDVPGHASRGEVGTLIVK